MPESQAVPSLADGNSVDAWKLWAKHTAEKLAEPVVEVGRLVQLFRDVLYWGFRRPFRLNQYVEALEFVGLGSVFIVSLTGTFVGMVFALQIVDGFRRFGAENQTGAVLGLALARELAPVFAALMVASRAGTAMTTELGSMRISQQIDALVTMAVNPIQFLIVPRVVAGVLAVPLLTMLFNLVGSLGAWLVAVKWMNLDPGIFVDKLTWYTDAKDVSQGLIKAVVFGLVITLIACRQGFFAKGGAAGVGRATNQSVVRSAVSILLLDYVITSFLL